MVPMPAKWQGVGVVVVVVAEISLRKWGLHQIYSSEPKDAGNGGCIGSHVLPP